MKITPEMLRCNRRKFWMLVAVLIAGLKCKTLTTVDTLLLIKNMLLVSRTTDFWKTMLLKCSITTVFSCLLLSWRKISSPFRENSNVVVFLFSFHIFMPLTNLWFIICFQGQISHPQENKLPWDLPITLGGRRFLIPKFIRSPSTLAIYDTAYSLPLGGVDRYFLFSENETRRHTSSAFREWLMMWKNYTLNRIGFNIRKW